jgi:hypothetical protein
MTKIFKLQTERFKAKSTSLMVALRAFNRTSISAGAVDVACLRFQ